VRPSTQDGFETLVHRHGWRGRGVAAPGRQPPSQGIMAARGGALSVGEVRANQV
jgi:hypothetical protein